jgi:hypothetical protein
MRAAGESMAAASVQALEEEDDPENRRQLAPGAGCRERPNRVASEGILGKRCPKPPRRSSDARARLFLREKDDPEFVVRPSVVAGVLFILALLSY